MQGNTHRLGKKQCVLIRTQAQGCAGQEHAHSSNGEEHLASQALPRAPPFAAATGTHGIPLGHRRPACGSVKPPGDLWLDPPTLGDWRSLAREEERERGRKFRRCSLRRVRVSLVRWDSRDLVRREDCDDDDEATTPPQPHTNRAQTHRGREGPDLSRTEGVKRASERRQGRLAHSRHRRQTHTPLARVGFRTLNHGLWSRPESTLALESRALLGEMEEDDGPPPGCCVVCKFWCKLACCPPCPRHITNKLAFLPPGPTYAFEEKGDGQMGMKLTAEREVGRELEAWRRCCSGCAWRDGLSHRVVTQLPASRLGSLVELRARKCG